MTAPNPHDEFAPQPLVVSDADVAMASGNFDDVAALIDPRGHDAVRRLFEKARAVKDPDAGDPAAVRASELAYADFLQGAIEYATPEGRELA